VRVTQEVGGLLLAGLLAGRVPPTVKWPVEKTEIGKKDDFDILTKTLSGDVETRSIRILR
jgi:hypothetical protein